MKEYHKIQTLLLRDPETNMKTLLPGEFAKPEFEYLFFCPWIITEKIDGTNIRVMYDGEKRWFGGRTDNAQIPARLVTKLEEMFPLERISASFPHCTSVTLYGEGFGAGIQKVGGNYMQDGCSFILFDVKVGDWWLGREDVEDVAAKLEIPVVPVLEITTLAEAVSLCSEGFNSSFGEFEAEGIVAKPRVELLNRKGERIVTKLKCRDFVR